MKTYLSLNQTYKTLKIKETNYMLVFIDMVCKNFNWNQNL